jgi:hypothetical protein
MPNDYAVAHKARKKAIEPDDSEPGVAHPAMTGLYYGSKPIINGVSQARGVVDRNIIDTDDTPIGPGYKPKQSKT